MREDHPRIVGLEKLRSLHEEAEYNPWSVAIRIEGKRHWLWRTLYWATGRLSLARAVIDLKSEVNNLRLLRIAGLRESDQAGALGLQLYAENKHLTEQVKELTARLDPKKYKETIEHWRSKFNAEEEKNLKLTRQYELLSESHKRFIEDYEVAVEKFFKEESK